MSMQDQQVRQACNTIASQIFLVAPHQHKDRNTNISNTAATTKSRGGVASRDISSANTNQRPSTTSSGRSDGRAEELRCLSNTVVRDAMTLYRLCRRPGGNGVVIVPSSSSSSFSGGGGAVSAAEEAAYCVCAVLISRVPLLWASLVCRAALLRPRKPTLCFAPPVMVPPVVIKEVVKFQGRSRHLVPASVISNTSSEGAGQLNSASSATPKRMNNAGTGMAAVGLASSDAAVFSVLSLQQAEAVAAAFFFKTMSPADRQRKPEIFEIRTPTACSSATGAAPAFCGVSNSARISAKLSGDASGESHMPSLVAPQHLLATLPTSKNKTAQQEVRGDLSGLLSRTPRPPLLSSSSLFLDDRFGWQGGRDGRSLLEQLTGATSFTIDGDSKYELEGSAGATRGRWLSRSNGSNSSSASSGRGSRASSADDSNESTERDATTLTTYRQHRRSRAATGSSSAATEAAVLERLYRLAIAADTAVMTNEEEEKDENNGMTDTCEGEAGTFATGDGSGHSVNPDGATSAGVSPFVSSSSSLFTGCKGMSLVSLTAMTTQVQDALHWGRLTALVRFPILFRGLSAPPLLAQCSSSTLPAAAVPVTTATILSASSEALTAASMTRLNNLLGSSYTSNLSSPAAVPAASLSTPFTNCGSGLPSSLSELYTMLDNFITSYGSPGSFLCPSRLRPSLLLPRPPSLVTDTFLWTRLLICGTWLAVYADSLVDDKVDTTLSPSASYVSDDEEETNKVTVTYSLLNTSGKKDNKQYVQPRVRTSPLVQEVVAYCVAVVKEARAISASLTDVSDASGTQYVQGSPNINSHNNVISAVCCPVCDGLVKEEQPVLWWSTLREDRALLREQVCTLLENSTATDAETRVVVATAADGLRDGRGGRAYPPPQLSGSAASGERVAALQERWAMYIMGAKDSAADKLSSASSVNLCEENGGGDASAVRQRTDTADDVGITQQEEQLDTAAQQPKVCKNEELNNSNDVADNDAASTLWAALAQRVAAATDLCTFLSTHPLPEGQLSATTDTVVGRTGLGKREAAPPAKDTRPWRSNMTAAAGARKRRRRSLTNSVTSEETTDDDSYDEEEGTSQGSVGTGVRDNKKGRLSELRTRRRTQRNEAESEHTNRHHRHRASRRKARDDDSAELYIENREEPVVTSASPSKVPGAFQGSRHSHEVAEEWEKLLRRCGWVNAAPPRASPEDSSSVERAKTPFTVSPPAFSSSSESPPVSLLSGCPAAPTTYARWAASLIVPAVLPTSQQAAVLRRRLSRYTLADVVRILVLGRGGHWRQYAKLLFGADAVPEEPATSVIRNSQSDAQSSRKETAKDANQSQRFKDFEQGHMSSFSAAAASPQRAASMSLLEEDLNGQTEVGEKPNDNDSAACNPSLLATGQRNEEIGGSVWSVGKMKRKDANASSNFPTLTAPDFFNPLSPSPSSLLRPPPRSQHTSAALSSPVKSLPSTPTCKSALPSIPLHVSPLSRNTAAGASRGVIVREKEKHLEAETAEPSEVVVDCGGQTSSDSKSNLLFSSGSTQPSAAAARNNSRHELVDTATGSVSAAPLNRTRSPAAVAESVLAVHRGAEVTNEVHDSAAPRSQLRAQQAALHALLSFHPRFPPLREEDAVLECGSCFSLFHQDCVAPVQRDLMGQIFLCHTCRLKWARSYVEKDGMGGLIHQSQELHS